MGLYRNKVACSLLEDEMFSPPRYEERNINFFFLLNMSPQVFTAEIMNDTFESDLHVIEHGNIHQHILKLWLYLKKKFCQSCLHPVFLTPHISTRITECVIG